MSCHSLILMRHGKSSWSDSSLSDHDRPLKKRGRRNAVEMGNYLASGDLIPEKIVCSTALRAKQTHVHLVLGMRQNPSVDFMEALYHASRSTLQHILTAQTPNLRYLMCIGHNPGLEDFLEWYAPGFHPSTETKTFPTASVAILQSDLPFHQWQPGPSVILTQILRPRDLPQQSSNSGALP